MGGMDENTFYRSRTRFEAHKGAMPRYWFKFINFEKSKNVFAVHVSALNSIVLYSERAGAGFSRVILDDNSNTIF